MLKTHRSKELYFTLKSRADFYELNVSFENLHPCLKIENLKILMLNYRIVMIYGRVSLCTDFNHTKEEIL